MRKTVYNFQTGESTSVDLTDEEVIAYESVVPVIKTPDLSFAQLLHGLVTSAWITEEEAYAWLDGTLPAPVVGAISQLPENMRLLATARAKMPSSISRMDPLVLLLAATQGKSDAEMDQFFATYSAV
jgi:hypothetical protein